MQLSTVLPRCLVEAEAERLGVVSRRRKVDIFTLVWAITLGFCSGAKRTLAGLQVVFEETSGTHLARSAFYDRLTPRMAQLLRSLATTAIQAMAFTADKAAVMALGFRDLLAVDSTVVRLRELLGGCYPASGRNRAGAAAKLHVVMRVADAKPTKVRLTSERTDDRAPWRRLEGWVEGCLLLFDLGYFSYWLFRRIDDRGGFFLSRLNTNANPLIVATNRRWRGNTVPVVGRRLVEVLPDLQRQVLDVEAEVEFKKRVYRKHRASEHRCFRLIAVRNDATQVYHCYVTNIPPERLSAEDVTAVYALRWQVELLFKSLKSHGHLDQLPSEKRAVVECLVWASVLAVIVSQALLDEVRRHLAPGRFVPLLRWAALFSRKAGRLLEVVLNPTERQWQSLLDHLLHQAPDPNVNRPGRAHQILVDYEHMVCGCAR